MNFSDGDRQALVELVNNIQHEFFSEQSANDGDSTRLALPCRFIRSAAEILEQVYQPQLIDKLDESELELLVTYLSKAIEAVKGSLEKVVTALPEQAPPGMLAKLEAHVADLGTLKQKREVLFAATRSLMEQESEILAEQRQLEELQERHEVLLATKEQLKIVDANELRAELTKLEVEIGPAGAELTSLQEQIALRRPELEAIENAIAAVRESLNALSQRSREQPDLIRVCEDLLNALNPYLEGTEKKIQDAVQAIALKTTEGRQLKEQLTVRVEEVSKVWTETSQLSAALALYAEANSQVAHSVPAVMNITREKLTRVEEELQEIDGDLRRAIEQHQSARHIAATASLDG